MTVSYFYTLFWRRPVWLGCLTKLSWDTSQLKWAPTAAPQLTAEPKTAPGPTRPRVAFPLDSSQSPLYPDFWNKKYIKMAKVCSVISSYCSILLATPDNSNILVYVIALWDPKWVFKQHVHIVWSHGMNLHYFFSRAVVFECRLMTSSARSCVQ